MKTSIITSIMIACMATGVYADCHPDPASYRTLRMPDKIQHYVDDLQLKIGGSYSMWSGLTITLQCSLTPSITGYEEDCLDEKGCKCGKYESGALTITGQTTSGGHTSASISPQASFMGYTVQISGSADIQSSLYASQSASGPLTKDCGGEEQFSMTFNDALTVTDSGGGQVTASVTDNSDGSFVWGPGTTGLTVTGTGSISGTFTLSSESGATGAWGNYNGSITGQVSLPYIGSYTFGLNFN